jgi:hypothetical protein
MTTTRRVGESPEPPPAVDGNVQQAWPVPVG